jgi:hypothetical protein
MQILLQEIIKIIVLSAQFLQKVHVCGIFSHEPILFNFALKSLTRIEISFKKSQEKIEYGI